MAILSKYSSGNVIKRYSERLFFFFFPDVWYVMVAFNDNIFKCVTQCEIDITMDLRFFFLRVVGGNERYNGILLLILLKENKITTA